MRAERIPVVVEPGNRPQEPTQPVLEVLAEAFASGKVKDKKAREELARKLCTSEWQIKRWRGNTKVTGEAMRRFQARAFYSLAEQWHAVEEAMAEKESWAFRLAAQVCTVLPVGGVSFQSTTLIDARTSGQSETAREFAKAFWARVQNAHKGGLQLIEAIQHEDPPTHIPDPTEPGGPVEPEPEPNEP